MDAKTKGIVMGTGGVITGLLSTQLVSWSTWPKALLATGVCLFVSIGLLVLLPKQKTIERTWTRISRTICWTIFPKARIRTFGKWSAWTFAMKEIYEVQRITHPKTTWMDYHPRCCSCECHCWWMGYVSDLRTDRRSHDGYRRDRNSLSQRECHEVDQHPASLVCRRLVAPSLKQLDQRTKRNIDWRTNSSTIFLKARAFRKWWRWRVERNRYAEFFFRSVWRFCKLKV